LLRLAIACYSAPSRLALDAHCSPKKAQFVTFRGIYKIPESTVIKILEGIELSQGEHEIIEDVIGFELPLKIAVAVEGEIVTVITNYPLKKGRKQ